MADLADHTLNAVFPISILDLPRELHIYLLDFLDWPTLTSLRLTCSSFRDLLPTKALVKHRIIRSTALWLEELALLSQLEKEFWEAAEESFMGYHSSSYTSSSLDPDIRAQSMRYTCESIHLPCYTCLRWLPSSTDASKFASESAFSRGRSTGTFNIGRKDGRKRNCITCGIRKGMYPRGTVVKHSVVCHRCQNLAQPVENWTWFWSDPTRTWQMAHYCRACIDLDHVKDLTKAQYRHERLWSRYEEGMRRGKEYRLEKGRKLREERGIATTITNGGSESADRDVKGGKKSSEPAASVASIFLAGVEVIADHEVDARARKRFCGVMQEDRLCSCKS